MHWLLNEENVWDANSEEKVLVISLEMTVLRVTFEEKSIFPPVNDFCVHLPPVPEDVHVEFVLPLYGHLKE